MQAVVSSTCRSMFEINHKDLNNAQGFENLLRDLKTLGVKVKTTVKIDRRESQYLLDSSLELINQLQLARFHSKFGRAIADHAM